MKSIVPIILTFISTAAYCQDVSDPEQEWIKYWDEQVEHFRDEGTSPLKEEDRNQFKAFELFGYNPEMRVTATYSPIDTADQFKMKTSGERTPLYKTVGKLEFSVGGIEEELYVYKNISLSKKAAYKHYLFVPFTDLTNFEETYGGGRYLDLEGPLGPQVTLDFNLAYNPYCAYSDGYSCPIPPLENHLEVPIKAGVLGFKDTDEH